MNKPRVKFLTKTGGADSFHVSVVRHGWVVTAFVSCSSVEAAMVGRAAAIEMAISGVIAELQR